MKIKVIIHQAEEGGYWAEVPAIPGCFTEGDSWEELIKNIYEAVEACLSVDVEKIKIKPSDRILDVCRQKDTVSLMVRYQEKRKEFRISLKVLS